MKNARWTAVVAVFVTTLLVASVALATVYIYEGKGVGSTRLGWNDHTAAARLSGYHKVVRDSRYSYTVYRWYVGRKMSNGKYPVELLSKADHRVFQFWVNSSSYPTYGQYVKVGSTESYLRRKYSTERRYPGSVYTRYRIGSRPFTDFYVRNSTDRVAYIVVGR